MTTEKSLVAEAENPKQQQQKEEEVAAETQKQEASLEEASQQVSEGHNQAEQKQKASNGDTPTHEDQNKNKERCTSESRGLSRLFSSFLKRPKSQVSEEGKEVENPQQTGEGGQKERDLEASPDEEILLKAPIAAPEPELRTDPSLDLHSLSSAETQPAQEDRREDQDLEIKEGDGVNEECSKAELKKENPETKADQELKVTQRSVRRHRNMYCKVSLLDDTIYECTLDKHAKGQDLLRKVCEHLNLLEEDYFGLAIWDSPTSKIWLDSTKEIKKQVHGGPWNFTFNVKFYPPDPAQLTEDITRYYLCLQLRHDIVTGRLPCSFATLALLSSYTVQSELGDYDPELHNTDYVSEFKLAPNQTKELEEKVMELHKTYRSMTPAQADLEFLENAKKLSMYGVDLHQAKDLEGVDITLGVCSSGLLIYKDKLRINRFPWPKVLKISYKRSSFFIKIRPGEQEQYESTIGFKLPSYRAAKKLWKVCVEHHTFFRLTSTETLPKSRFLALGSKFRYSGRTQAQTRQASALIDRPAPQFERTASKRASRSLDGAKHTSQVEVRPIVEEKQDDVVMVEIPESKPVEQFREKPAKHTFENIEMKSIAEEEEEEKMEVFKVTVPESKLMEPFQKQPVIRVHENIEITPINEEEEEEKVVTMKDLELEPKFLEPVQKEPAVAVITPDRSPRPTSAPAIAQRHVAEPTPPASSDTKEIVVVSKVEKEALDTEGKREEMPYELVKMEPPEVAKELDKTQDEIKKHHANISELKKNFMESVPEPRPNEWDKRLSTHSPFRTFNVNGQVSTGVEGVKKATILSSERRVGGPEPPLVKTQTVTISDVSNAVKSEIPTKEVPIVHTETKTITYEAAQIDDGNGDLDPGVLLTAQTITSETTSSTTTTQITKTVKGGISETRIEKRIVITGDADIDHDQVLVQAIKEAKEQHPDMSVTKVVVHQETEITDE
nr:protein 4.1 isoform X22 [Pelodiscus sinensis]|eukprot:XP_014432082.1 protein 4.1 isoform X22 [Pelodiscus sinensis]